MPSPLLRPLTSGGAGRPMRRDGATDRLTTDHRLPARHRRAFLFQVKIMTQILSFPSEASSTHPHVLPADIPVANPLPKLLVGEDLPIDHAQHLFERLA